MSLYDNILVPVDFSEDNAAALEAAGRLAAESRGAVSLLHVIESVGTDEDEEVKRFYGRLATEAAGHMEKAAAALPPGEYARRTEILVGHRVRAILEFAESESCDLIVMSSHRIRSDDPAGWITISYRVAMLAPCPVLLVK